MSSVVKTSRAVLVTGGAVRLGAAIVERLAQDGFAVAIHCRRSASRAEALADRIGRENGVKTCVVQADLVAADFQAILDRARDRLGFPLTGLVNSASIFEADTAQDVDPASLESHLAVNLKAPVLLSQAFAAQAPDGSSIVNLLDQRVLHTDPRYFSYSLSKAALHAATRTMAQAFAPEVRVNGVAPGLTLVNPRQDEADYQRRIATLPLRRGGSPREVADAVGFLFASPSVTGQTIAIDGGQHLAWRTPDVPNG